MPATPDYPPPRQGARVAAVAVRVVAVLAAVAVMLVVVGLAILAADRVPFSSHNVVNMERFLGLVLAVWVVGISGAVWLIALLFTWRWRHLRTRWLAVAPALLLAGGTAVVIIAVAVPGGFEMSRDDLDALVVEARSHPAGWTERYGYDSPRQVGDLEVESVAHRDDGVVLVRDADTLTFSFEITGWAHSPIGPPGFDPDYPGLKIERIAGPWYSYVYGG